MTRDEFMNCGQRTVTAVRLRIFFGDNRVAKGRKGKKFYMFTSSSCNYFPLYLPAPGTEATMDDGNKFLIL